MSFVFLFPGQSSRYPEMIERARAMAPREAARVCEAASDAIGEDVLARLDASRPDVFETNTNVQLAVFLTSQIHLHALSRVGIVASRSLGLSLGEYGHLVHIGALDLGDAFRLLLERGRAYDAGPRGAMASVFPICEADLDPLLGQARSEGRVEITGETSPTQLVVSGDQLALKRLEELVDQEQPGSAFVWIERHVPMHASFFRPAAELFRPALESAPFSRPRLPYLPNVSARSTSAPSHAALVDSLYRHVFSRVLFRQSIEHVLEIERDPIFIEVGPRGVLTGLLRRFCPRPRYMTDGQGDPRTTFVSLLEELERAA